MAYIVFLLVFYAVGFAFWGLPMFIMFGQFCFVLIHGLRYLFVYNRIRRQGWRLSLPWAFFHFRFLMLKRSYLIPDRRTAEQLPCFDGSLPESQNLWMVYKTALAEGPPSMLPAARLHSAIDSLSVLLLLTPFLIRLL